MLPALADEPAALEDVLDVRWQGLGLQLLAACEVLHDPRIDVHLELVAVLEGFEGARAHHDGQRDADGIAEEDPGATTWNPAQPRNRTRASTAARHAPQFPSRIPAWICTLIGISAKRVTMGPTVRQRKQSRGRRKFGGHSL